jgi:hypothetical protein
MLRIEASQHRTHSEHYQVRHARALDRSRSITKAATLI